MWLHPSTLFLLAVACDPTKIALDTDTIDRDIGELDTLETGDITDTGLGDTDTTGNLPDTEDPTDSGSTTDSDSTTEETTEDTEPPRPDALWCLDFEDGTLEGAGYGEADFVELSDGALVFNAEEGDDFSALNGEESIGFRGDRLLGLRSSHDGDVESVSIATSPLFVVEQPALFWWLLSEVDERGVYLGLDIISDAGAVLASAEVPARTGGHVPGLEPEHEPIDGFPEIVVGGGTAGEFSPQQIDLSPYLGQTVKLRLYQHTREENQGFFTLLDDICHGEPIEEAESVTLGDPLDHGV